LDPLDVWDRQALKVRKLAQDLDLSLAIETGARFLLDPERKHGPNLMDGSEAERNRRIDFYRRSLDVAQAVGASVLSLWSGAADPADRATDEALYARLAEGLVPVLEHANQADITLCFEPEPGMFVERVDQYHTLKQAANGALQAMKMTLDVGHCLVTGEITPEQAIRENASEIAHVHLDDIRSHVHEHTMFGQGDLNLPAVLKALDGVAFSGMAAVELSRDSYRGAWAAKEAMQRLRLARSF
jgi:sugar phosphate isomerase/epimerase